MKNLQITLTFILFLTAAATFAAPPISSSIESILATNGAQQSLESTLAGVEGKNTPAIGINDH